MLLAWSSDLTYHEAYLMRTFPHVLYNTRVVAYYITII